MTDQIKMTEPKFSVDDVRDIIRSFRGVNGSTIPAIKWVRTMTQLPLKDAKDIVDDIFSLPILGQEFAVNNLKNTIERLEENQLRDRGDLNDKIDQQQQKIDRVREYVVHLEGVIFHLLRE